MKRFFALFLAVVMCAALAVPAFAASTDPAPTGTLSIVNADHGKNYTIIRVFDADVAYDKDGKETSVSYTVKHDETATSMYSILKAGTNYVNGETTIECPFQLDLTHDHGVGADVPVSHKTPSEGQDAEFGRGWMYQMYKSGKYVPADSNKVTKQLSADELNTLVFDNLPYGYYIVFADGAEIATAVTLKASETTIYDKNTRTPGDPDKKIKLENGELVPEAEAQVGDVVNYVASFQATNYRTVAGDSRSAMITEYKIADRATGVKYKSMDSVKLYTTKNEDGTFSGFVADLMDENLPEEDRVSYTMEKDGAGNITGYYASVKWANPVYKEDGKTVDHWESKYPSPVYLVVEYQMYITEKALTLANGNTAKNTFSPSYVVEDKTTVDIPNPPSTKVHTSGLAIMKVDDYKTPLAGAKFKLSKLVPAVDPETKEPVIDPETQKPVMDEVYYSLAKRHSDVTGEDWQDVEWVSEDDALEVEADNMAYDQTFGGLESGTYYLYETQAPHGFYAPATPWQLEISYNEKTNTFSAKISADGGNTWTDLDYSKDATATYAFFSTTIVNKGSKNLPNTGAAGTTMLLVSGAVLFMGTALLLVTKKRLYNENF